MKPVRVPLPVLVGLGAFVVWASATNRLSLWSSQLGAWVRSNFGDADFWNRRG